MIRLNEILTYKELCKEFNEVPCIGGTNRNKQLKRFRKLMTIDKIDSRHFIITKEGQDSKITSENKIRNNLLEFCKLRHITLLEKPCDNIHSTDEIKYVCNFHPDVIQTATVSSLLRSIGCSICKYPMSRMEVALFLSIPNSIHRYKLDGIEFDIFIPKENVLIEYNGYLYHQGEEDLKLREKKKVIAEKYNYRLINIEEITNSEIVINKDVIVIPSYSISNKVTKDKIIETLEQNIPLCKFTSNIWNEAADYMRDWKFHVSTISNKKIQQYDEQGNLINEFNGFNEIKELIKSGSAFGFNWVIV